MSNKKGFKVGKSLIEASKRTKDNSICRTRLTKGDCCQ
jgi:hypothetical protein